MFQPDQDQWPMGAFHTILPPHFLGGVAPSRHDVALAAYLEKQAAQRAAISARRPSPEIAKHLRKVLFETACRLAGVVWQSQHGRFGTGRLNSGMK